MHTIDPQTAVFQALPEDLPESFCILFDHYDATHEQWMQETIEARAKEEGEEGEDD